MSEFSNENCYVIIVIYAIGGGKMKYETTQTGWVSGEECYAGNTNIRYEVIH